MASGSAKSLLLIIGTPHSDKSKNQILSSISTGLNGYAAGGDSLNEELQFLLNSNDFNNIGDGHKQQESENLNIDILFNPSVEKLHFTLKSFLATPYDYRQIIYAGKHYKHCGSWILADGAFGVTEFNACNPKQKEGCDVIHVNSTSNFKSLLKSNIGKIFTLKEVEVTSAKCEVVEVVVDRISAMVTCSEPLQCTTHGTDAMKSAQRPTMLVFPAGSGDCSLFQVDDFKFLINAGYKMQPCFKKCMDLCDNIDCVAVTHASVNNFFGLQSLLNNESKKPKIKYCLTNITADKAIPVEDSNVIDVIAKSKTMIGQLKSNGTPVSSLSVNSSDIKPTNLYHKIGVGNLNVYPISGSPSSVKSVKTEAPTSMSFLLVWTGAAQGQAPVRILVPGDLTQSKLLEGLEHYKSLKIIQAPLIKAKLIKKEPVKHKVMSDVKSEAKPASEKKRSLLSSSKPRIPLDKVKASVKSKVPAKTTPTKASTTPSKLASRRLNTTKTDIIRTTKTESRSKSTEIKNKTQTSKTLGSTLSSNNKASKSSPISSAKPRSTLISQNLKKTTKTTLVSDKKQSDKLIKKTKKSDTSKTVTSEISSKKIVSKAADLGVSVTNETIEKDVADILVDNKYSDDKEDLIEHEEVNTTTTTAISNNYVIDEQVDDSTITTNGTGDIVVVENDKQPEYELNVNAKPFEPKETCEENYISVEKDENLKSYSPIPQEDDSTPVSAQSPSDLEQLSDVQSSEAMTPTVDDLIDTDDISLVSDENGCCENISPVLDSPLIDCEPLTSLDTNTPVENNGLCSADSMDSLDRYNHFEPEMVRIASPSAELNSNDGIRTESSSIEPADLIQEVNPEPSKAFDGESSPEPSELVSQDKEFNPELNISRELTPELSEFVSQDKEFTPELNESREFTPELSELVSPNKQFTPELKSESREFTPELSELNAQNGVNTPEPRALNAEASEYTPEISESDTREREYTPETSELNTQHVECISEASELNTHEREVTPEINELNTHQREYTPEINESNTQYIEYTPEASELNTQQREYTPEASELNTQQREYTPEKSELNTQHREYTPEASELNTQQREYTPEASELNTQQREYTPEASELYTQHREYTPEASELNTQHREYTPEASEIEVKKLNFEDRDSSLEPNDQSVDGVYQDKEYTRELNDLNTEVKESSPQSAVINAEEDDEYTPHSCITQTNEYSNNFEDNCSENQECNQINSDKNIKSDVSEGSPEREATPVVSTEAASDTDFEKGFEIYNSNQPDLLSQENSCETDLNQIDLLVKTAEIQHTESLYEVNDAEQIRFEENVKREEEAMIRAHALMTRSEQHCMNAPEAIVEEDHTETNGVTPDLVATIDPLRDPLQDSPLNLPSPALLSQSKNKTNLKHKRIIPTSKLSPICIEMAFIPCHGDMRYMNTDFFTKIRSRYYVLSSLNPSVELFDTLLAAKKTWPQNTEVTVIATYMTEAIKYWIAENKQEVEEFKISVCSPADDDNDVVSAYGVEF